MQFVGVNFVSGYFNYLTYYFKLAGVTNTIARAQVAFVIQLFGDTCSWPLVDRLERRPMIVGGMFIMTGLLLLIIGGLSTIGSSSALNATIAFMTILGLFGRTPMDEPRYDSLLTLLKHGRGESRGKVCLIFFDLSLPMCVYWYFRLPELKGRTVAEVQEMFQDGLPTIQDAVERY